MWNWFSCLSYSTKYNLADILFLIWYIKHKIRLVPKQKAKYSSEIHFCSRVIGCKKINLAEKLAIFLCTIFYVSFAFIFEQKKYKTSTRCDVLSLLLSYWEANAKYNLILVWINKIWNRWRLWQKRCFVWNRFWTSAKFETFYFV